MKSLNSWLHQSNQEAIIWRRLFFIIAIVCLYLVYFLISQINLGDMKYIPVIVELEPNGGVKSVNHVQPEVIYNPTEEQIKFFLREFIAKTRSAPMDRVIIRKNIDQAKFFVANSQQPQKMFSGLCSGLWQKTEAGNTVSVSILPIIKRSDSSYQINWVETNFSKAGTVIMEEKFYGLFSVKIIQPRTLDEIHNNPVGLKITYFEISTDGGRA